MHEVHSCENNEKLCNNILSNIFILNIINISLIDCLEHRFPFWGLAHATEPEPGLVTVVVTTVHVYRVVSERCLLTEQFDLSRHASIDNWLPQNDR